MLSFSRVAEALTGLIYHRPSGENSKFLPFLTRVRVIHTKDVRIRKLGNLTMLIVRCHVLRLMKGVLNGKKQACRQHVVNKQYYYAAAAGKNSHPTQIA